VVNELSKAFALAVPHPEAIRIRDDVGFFQTVRAGILKAAMTGRKTPEELDTAIRQIVSKAVASEGIVDIFDLTPESRSRPYVRIRAALDLKGRSDHGEETSHGRADHRQAAAEGIRRGGWHARSRPS
jgi:type I site-specific restriction-modification system R (restriction) subunit